MGDGGKVDCELRLSGYVSPDRKVLEIKAYTDMASGNTSIERRALRYSVEHTKVIEVFQKVS